MTIYGSRVCLFAALPLCIAVATAGCGKVSADAPDGGQGQPDASGPTFTLTVSLAGGGTGTVTSAPAGIDCGDTCAAGFAPSTQVTLTPAAAVASSFAGWSGDCAGLGECTVALDADRSVTATFEPGGSVNKAVQFGGDARDFVHRMIADKDGNVIVTGSFTGTINFGGDDLVSKPAGVVASEDVFVAKFAPAGDHIWSVSFGGAGKDLAFGLEADSDGNIFVSGEYPNPITIGLKTHPVVGSKESFVAKLAGATGAPIWSESFTGPAAVQNLDLTVDGNDDVIVAFDFKGTAAFGDAAFTANGGSDVVIAKYSGVNGSHVFSDHYGSTAGDDQIVAIDTDSNDNILIFGYFNGTLNLGGVNDLVQGGTGRDQFLARYDNDGAHDWSRAYSSTDAIFTGFGKVDADGDFVVGGRFAGTANFGGNDHTSTGDLDIYIAKYLGNNGSHVWSKQYSGAGFKSPRGFDILSSGDVVVGGFYNLDVDFDGTVVTNAARTNLFAARLAEATGDLVWLTSFGDVQGAGGGVGRAIAVGLDDRVYFGGTFNDSVTFGPGNELTSVSGALEDIALVQMLP